MRGTWTITLLDDVNHEVASFNASTIKEMYSIFIKEYPSYAPTSLGLMNHWASARSGPHVKFRYVPKQATPLAERNRRHYEKVKSMHKELEVLRKKMAELETTSRS
jgi:hypothetical protein